MIWAFDLDGTLIGSIRADRIRPGAVELLSELVRGGATCVLWSAGGAEYARRKAAEHGLDGYFAGCYSKGERSAVGHYTVGHLPVEHRPHVFVDDMAVDLPADFDVISVPQFIGGNDADRSLFEILDRVRS